MPFVITAPCIADYSCVEICPADCIHPTPDEPGFEQAEQLFIDPQSCIECEACVDACPVDAVYPGDAVPERWQQYAQINRDYFASATHG